MTPLWVEDYKKVRCVFKLHEQSFQMNTKTLCFHYEMTEKILFEFTAASSNGRPCTPVHSRKIQSKLMVESPVCTIHLYIG